MRVGLFGGSFDPIHRGHIETVREARSRLGLDKVIFLPTARPPHKLDQRLAPAVARFTMVELALLDEEALEVSDHELTLDRPAYAIDTLEHFAAEPGTEQVTLLIGSDSLAALDSWRRWQDIVSLYRIGVLSRAGADLGALRDSLPPAVRRADAAGRLRWVENRPVEASSTEIRRCLAAGEPLPEDWLPALVLKYLRKYPNLYV